MIAAHRGHLDEAEECYRRGLAGLERLGHRGGMTRFRGALAALAAQKGDLAKAEEEYQQCLVLQQQAGDERAQVWTWNALTLVTLERGDLRVAADRARTARQLARRVTTVSAEVIAILGLARVRARAGRARAARMLLEHARTVVAHHGVVTFQHYLAVAAGEIYLDVLGARPELIPEARAAAEEMLRGTGGPVGPLQEALAHRLLGLLGLLCRDFRVAIAELRIALDMLQEMGPPLDRARTQLVRPISACTWG